jgi:hypothetical protein
MRTHKVSTYVVWHTSPCQGIFFNQTMLCTYFQPAPRHPSQTTLKVHSLKSSELKPLHFLLCVFLQGAAMLCAPNKDLVYPQHIDARMCVTPSGFAHKLFMPMTL